jgi:hypothetical protein
MGILSLLIFASVNAFQQPEVGELIDRIHPNVEFTDLNPEEFKGKIIDMDYLSDGRLVVGAYNWPNQGENEVYILDGIQSNDPDQITFEQYWGPTDDQIYGIAVADDQVYVSLRNHRVVRILDQDNDGFAETEEEIIKFPDWGVHWNVGLEYYNGSFYIPLSGQSFEFRPDAPPERGTIYRFDVNGQGESIGSGMRQQDGITFGPEGEIFTTDNQGNWLPASKLIHVEKDGFYGHRNTGHEGEESPPVSWLPYWEMGISPTEPVYVDKGLYTGQIFSGDISFQSIFRFFIEKVQGQYQSAFFLFTGGMSASIQSMLVDEDGSILLGGLGVPNVNNYFYPGKAMYGLERMRFTGNNAFEMLKVRARQGGMEIEFTRPVGGMADNTDSYDIRSWYYVPTENYGGPKMDDKRLDIASIQIHEDRKRVFLEIPGLEEGRVVRIRLDKNYTSETGQECWSPQAAYTLNKFGTSQPFTDDIAVKVRKGSEVVSNHEPGIRIITNSSCHISFEVPGNDPYSYELSDISGKVWESGKEDMGDVTNISKAEISGGVYILQVQNGKNLIRHTLTLF